MLSSSKYLFARVSYCHYGNWYVKVVELFYKVVVYKQDDTR